MVPLTHFDFIGFPIIFFSFSFLLLLLPETSCATPAQIRSMPLELVCHTVPSLNKVWLDRERIFPQFVGKDGYVTFHMTSSSRAEGMNKDIKQWGRR